MSKKLLRNPFVTLAADNLSTSTLKFMRSLGCPIDEQVPPST